MIDSFVSCPCLNNLLEFSKDHDKNVVLNIAARIRRMGKGNSFSLLVCPHTGGGGSTPAKVGTPSPLAKVGTPIQGRYAPPASQGRYPRQRWVPPRQLATRRAVCLLRSRRRTFLLWIKLTRQKMLNKFSISKATVKGRNWPWGKIIVSVS